MDNIIELNEMIQEYVKKNRSSIPARLLLLLGMLNREIHSLPEVREEEE